jgi:hypothetical protein
MPLRAAVMPATIKRLRDRAGLAIMADGEPSRINLIRLIAWLAAQRHSRRNQDHPQSDSGASTPRGQPRAGPDHRLTVLAKAWERRDLQRRFLRAMRSRLTEAELTACERSETADALDQLEQAIATGRPLNKTHIERLSRIASL